MRRARMIVMQENDDAFLNYSNFYFVTRYDSTEIIQ